MATTAFGSFSAWARVVGGVLQVAGISGFLDNRELYLASHDVDSEWWSSAAQILADHRGGYSDSEPVTAVEWWGLLGSIHESAPLDGSFGISVEREGARWFSLQLRGLDGAVRGGYRIERFRDGSGRPLKQAKTRQALWTLRPARPASAIAGPERCECSGCSACARGNGESQCGMLLPEDRRADGGCRHCWVVWKQREEQEG